jgi:hypothetical protein
MPSSDTEEDFLKSLEAHGPNDDHPFSSLHSPSRENSPSGGTPPPENGEEDQLWHGPPALDERVVDPGLTVGATATTAASQELVEMAQRVKRYKSLSERSESNLDKFAVVSHWYHIICNIVYIISHRPTRWLVTWCSCMLACSKCATWLRNFSKTAPGQFLMRYRYSTWILQRWPDLHYFAQDDLQKYATTFVLSHNISSYRGKVSKALMVMFHLFVYIITNLIRHQDAMRELNISTLPPLKETSQNKQVITELGNCLTQARFTLRDLVGPSSLAVLFHADYYTVHRSSSPRKMKRTSATSPILLMPLSERPSSSQRFICTCVWLFW